MIRFIGKNESEIDTFITPWTFIHFLSGLYITYGIKYMNKYDVFAFLMYNLIHLIYEIKDYVLTYYYKRSRTYEDNKPHILYNSYTNSLGDLIFGLMGSLLIIYLIQYNNKILSKNILIVFTIVSMMITLSFILGFSKYNIA